MNPENKLKKKNEPPKKDFSKKKDAAKKKNQPKKKFKSGSKKEKADVKNKFNQPNGKNIVIWVVVITAAMIIAQFISTTPDIPSVSFTTFQNFVDKGLVGSAEIIGSKFIGELKEPMNEYESRQYGVPIKNTYSKFSTVLPYIDSEMIEKWNEQNIIYEFKEQTFDLFDYLIQFSPWLILIFVWIFLMRKMQGGTGQGGIFGFGKSRAKIISPDSTEITFKNVAGCDEAKVELLEIVEFLKTPKKFIKLGAKIPRGALLLGPPGTGKTLLARAVSGEAGVPFFSISGAEFVEMFVGVGASRVRDLFDQAKRNSPSIIFVDEIDAVGRHRGAGLGGGHDEREQTLNQILVEMDGFESDDNVIMLAATNRPDVLDKALLRPGRFDRQIVVDVPGISGREAILKIHTKKIPLAKNVDLKIMAKGSPGLVGADLENLCNEAALLAARRKKNRVTMVDFEDAKDKVMMGVERKSMIMTMNERKITAYHEAGHALIAAHTKGADPVHKISIIPRGRAMGITAQLPDEEKHNYTKKFLIGQLSILMGGRSAEKITFNDTSTGAGNDIERATAIARSMVCEWGMSEKIGPLTFGKKSEEVFLGREISHSRDYSDQISQLIDKEITTFVRNAENRATDILKTHDDQLENLAKALLEYETLSGKELQQIIKGEAIERTVKSEKPPRQRRRPRRRPKSQAGSKPADTSVPDGKDTVKLSKGASAKIKNKPDESKKRNT